MKILLVDDDVRNIELLEALLEPEKYQTVSAASGESALNILEQTKVDMILLDIMLPGMSGIDVLKRIRANKALQTMPILLLTALTQKEDKIAGLAAGADDYISKPFDKAELLARVKTLAQLSYLRSQLAEKEKFEGILEATNEGIVVTDPQFVPVTINKTGWELLEIGKELPKNILKHINETFRYGITIASLEKEFKNFVLKRPETKDYNPLYLATVIQSIKNPAGEIVQYVFIFKNITSEYLEKNLKYNFLSLISHKFRSPLTVMSGSADILMTLEKDPDHLEYLKKILKSLQDLQNILNRLFRFLEMNIRDFNETISLDIIDEIVSKQGDKYGFSYVFNKNFKVKKAGYWQIMVIEELIDNSFKFFTGSQLRIDLAIDNDTMEITDNGVGIPPEETTNVFEPFYQIDKYFTGQVPGMGLGLALVKRLVKLHNGTIEFKSTINSGTNIIINLEKGEGAN
ncbi:MAG TPA: hypothetical protein DEE98_07715 [Elusimicrobia bacterium]|nr:MAG: hypothetical protein A2278_00550 [Elusimicrobia bacterium RIFOXYA12_FULL_49_49]OGS06175.1 MAG: hypothetical protein A2204_05455 [Elusimicrobia bacterium RIFOXYA1_FULL_47_7]OGS11015.1 MAG: hypothetical protein A2386_00355 [Elusimicrobia bacterium RIFOXYB1_FULL_48_9]OGS15148.1 MAG: hypothetical protein A2251_00560 [Elusimicrobia bacterium RIFOXYA2_FULL_47_53]OGS29768.1 MAG: hypothetical protein A2323_01360 [Elusimicrobia bacterium RIFOXYB2_FULL_46_23]HBU70250.1 hypothetical protein [Elus